MELARFLKQRDIIFIISAGAISSQVIALSDLLTTVVVVPIINNIREYEEGFENAKSEIRGVKFEHGKLLVALIRVIILLLMLLLLFKLMY